MPKIISLCNIIVKSKQNLFFVVSQGGRIGTDSPLGPGMDLKFTTPPPNMPPLDAEFHDKFAAMTMGAPHRSNFSPIKV